MNKLKYGGRWGLRSRINQYLKKTEPNIDKLDIKACVDKAYEKMNKYMTDENEAKTFYEFVKKHDFFKQYYTIEDDWRLKALSDFLEQKAKIEDEK